MLQINTLVAESADVKQVLEVQNVSLEPHPWLSDAFYASGTGNLEQLELFRQGAFLVQDPAARLAVLAADLRPGMRVLDCCAAPGGKSFAAAMAMNNQGTLTSCDIHEHKISLLQKGAERLQISILEPKLHDARSFEPQWEQTMDVVLADVPCSGLGVIRKKPDIRYKDLRDLERLPDIQTDILENVSRYVKPGGTLIYSTCTILRRENEDIVTAFLQRHPEYSPDPFSIPEALGGGTYHWITLLPSIHDTDGFFICKLNEK